MAVTTPASPASPRVATQVGVPATRIRTPRSGVALFAALVAVCAYAVFAHGAVGLPEEPRLQIGLACVGVGAANSATPDRGVRMRVAGTPACVATRGPAGLGRVVTAMGSGGRC